MQGERELLGKEFVIDIDINDYPARTCCQKRPTVCCRCWAYLVLAIKVVSRTLREDLGFRRLLWVYSGRRGVHLWVCDREAVLLKDSERQDIMKSLDGFRCLGGKEVSTWRPGAPNEKIGKADRMRRPIEPQFRYETYTRYTPMSH